MVGRYPLFFLFISFLAGAIYFYHFPVNVLYVFFAMAFVGGFLLFSLLLKHHILSGALVFAVFFLIACVWVTFFIPPNLSYYLNKYVLSYGVVRKVLGKQRALILPYWVRYKGRSKDVGVKTVLFFPKGVHLKEGNCILLKGKFRLLQEPETDYQFNYRYHYWGKMVFFSMSVSSSRYIMVIGRKHLGFLSELRHRISTFVKEHMEEDTAALLLSVTVGDRGSLSDNVRRLFYRLGLGHILAISGLHVGIIVSFVLLLTSLLLLPLWYRLVVASLFLIFYLLFVGFVPSVFRSVVMGVVFLLSWWRGDRYNGVNILGLAGLVFLFINPFAWMDAGFVLSFIVTFFLLYCMPYLTSGRGAWIFLKVLFIAQLSSLPFVLYFFNFYNLLSVPANILVVPMVSTVIIPIGILGEVLGLISATLGNILLFVVDVVSKLMLDVLRFLYDVHGFSLSVPVFSVWIVVVFYTGIFLLFLWRSFRFRYVKFVSIGLLGLGVFLLCSEFGYIRIVHLGNTRYFTVMVGMPFMKDALVVSNIHRVSRYPVVRLGKVGLKKVGSLSVRSGRIKVDVLPDGRVFINGVRMPVDVNWAVKLKGGWF